MEKKLDAGASQLKRMQQWLDSLEKAISLKDSKRIIELYDENLSRPWSWDSAPEDMQERLDNLTDKGNAICYGY